MCFQYILVKGLNTKETCASKTALSICQFVDTLDNVVIVFSWTFAQKCNSHLSRTAHFGDLATQLVSEKGGGGHFQSKNYVADFGNRAF